MSKKAKNTETKDNTVLTLVVLFALILFAKTLTHH